MKGEQTFTYGGYRQFFAHHIQVVLLSGLGLVATLKPHSDVSDEFALRLMIFCGLTVYLWYHLRKAASLSIGTEGVTVKKLLGGRQHYYPYRSLSSIGYTPPVAWRHGVDCARLFINTEDGVTNRYVLPVGPGRTFDKMVQRLQQNIKTEDITWW